MHARLLPLATGLLLLAAAAGPVSAAGPASLAISSSIAPGVVTGTDGFGSSSVVVPTAARVTFRAVTDPPLPGHRIEIWTRSRTTDWRLTTARLEAADGSVRYVATITEWTAIQARFPADSTHPATASHGRIATTSARGLTAIGVTCDEFAAAGGGEVSRSINAQSGDFIAFTLCANASTGFAWLAPTYDTASLRLIGVRTFPPAKPLPGAAGTETWTFKLLSVGTSNVSLIYSQPWAGGTKAAWRFTLKVAVPRPTGFSCTSSAHVAATASGEPLVQLSMVTVGSHPGYDRIVLEFGGDSLPQLDVATARPPFIRDPSGLPVSVAGSAFLRLTLREATGAGTEHGPTSMALHGPRLTTLVQTGDFEGVVTWIAGLTGPACLRVSTLAQPTRIVVDLRAP